MSKKKSWKNKFGVVKNGVLKEFTVYRGSWANNDVDNEYDVTSLLNRSGGRCCVGFMAAACGVSDEALQYNNVVGHLGPLDRARCVPSDWPDTIDPFDEAYDLNDAIGPASLRVRERRIANWFKRTFDVKVNFVDGKTPEGK